MRIKSDAFFHQIVSEWTLMMITVTQMKQKCSETAALLVFWGSFSAGKTHLFHCLCKMIPATFWRISMVTHSSQKDPSCTAHSSLEKGLISCLFRRIVWNEWQTGDVWHVILSPWHPHPKNKIIHMLLWRLQNGDVVSPSPTEQEDDTACTQPLISSGVCKQVRNSLLIIFIKTHQNSLFSSLDHFVHFVDDSELGAVDYKVWVWDSRQSWHVFTNYGCWMSPDSQSALWPGAKSVRWDSKPRRGCMMK